MDTYIYFTRDELSALRKALRVKKGQKAKDGGPGKAGDIAVEVYRRNFMSGVGGDIAYAAVRIGIKIGSRKGQNADVIIKAIEGFFSEEDDRLSKAVPCTRG